MTTRLRRTFLSILLLASCADNGGTPDPRDFADAGEDVSIDALPARDVGVDATVNLADAGTDAGAVDADGPDANAPRDSGLDVTLVDAAMDSGMDAAMDAPDAMAPEFALRFDNSEARLFVDPTNEVAAAFTIEVWARYRGTGTQVLVSNRSSRTNGFLLAVMSGRFLVQVGGFNQTAARIDDDEWHHIALVRDDTNTVRLYVDGSAAERTLVRPEPVQTSNPFLIGADYGGGFRADADMRGLRVWNVARSAEEIVAGIAVNVDSGSPGLLVDVPMNEGEGQILTDRVGGPGGVLGTDSIIEDTDATWVLRDAPAP